MYYIIPNSKKPFSVGTENSPIKPQNLPKESGEAAALAVAAGKSVAALAPGMDL